VLLAHNQIFALFFMGVLEELQKTRKKFFSFLIFWLILSFFFLFFSPKFFLLSKGDSFSTLFLNFLKKNLLPQNVKFVVLSPMDPFLAQVITSLILGFFISFPVFLIQTLNFIFPALFENEKKLVLKILLPVIFLFFLGSLFGFFLILPATFKILYSFAIPLGAVPYLEIQDFLIWTFGLTFACGLIFLFPILMIFLTKWRLVEVSFWKTHFKEAFVFFLLLSAFITPDGTGITMILLTLPLTLLYFLGYNLAKVFK
jgi:sec-independent protein translocase protein TatC